jgi:magnesium chelatase subunit D
MSAQLSAAKGAALALLQAAYIRRDRVGLIAFWGEEAQILLPPTSSIHLARKKLRHLSSGGATPFADGLVKAWNVIRAEKLKAASRETVLVIVSDGEANVALAPMGNKLAEIYTLTESIRQEGVRIIFVDTNTPEKDNSEAVQIAAVLKADYRRISKPRSGDLVDIVGL